MNNYLVIIGGFIVGQLFQLACAAWALQKKDEKLSWTQAIWSYIKKGQGAFATSMAALLLALYLFPEIKDKGKILENLRWYSAIFGIFAQWIAYLGFGIGKKVIDTKAKAEGVEPEPK